MNEELLNVIAKDFKQIKERLAPLTSPGYNDQLDPLDYRAAEQVAGRIVSALIIAGYYQGAGEARRTI